MKNFEFLKSTRFWFLVASAIVGVLKAESLVPDDIANALIAILLGSVGIRTLDRASEKIGEAK